MPTLQKCRGYYNVTNISNTFERTKGNLKYTINNPH